MHEVERLLGLTGATPAERILGAAEAYRKRPTDAAELRGAVARAGGAAIPALSEVLCTVHLVEPAASVLPLELLDALDDPAAAMAVMDALESLLALAPHVFVPGVGEPGPFARALSMLERWQCREAGSRLNELAARLLRAGRSAQFPEGGLERMDAVFGRLIALHPAAAEAWLPQAQAMPPSALRSYFTPRGVLVREGDASWAVAAARFHLRRRGVAVEETTPPHGMRPALTSENVARAWRLIRTDPWMLPVPAASLVLESSGRCMFTLEEPAVRAQTEWRLCDGFLFFEDAGGWRMTLPEPSWNNRDEMFLTLTPAWFAGAAFPRPFQSSSWRS